MTIEQICCKRSGVFYPPIQVMADEYRRREMAAQTLSVIDSPLSMGEDQRKRAEALLYWRTSTGWV